MNTTGQSDSEGTMMETQSLDRASLVWSTVTATLTLLMIGIIYGIGVLNFGSTSSMLSYVSGDRIIVDAANKNIGSQKPNEVLAFSYGITNMTKHPIAIIGAKASCSCAVVENLPLTIAEGERRAIQVEVTTPSEAGAFGSGIILYTDDESESEIRLILRGNVSQGQQHKHSPVQ